MSGLRADPENLVRSVPVVTSAKLQLDVVLIELVLQNLNDHADELFVIEPFAIWFRHDFTSLPATDVTVATSGLTDEVRCSVVDG
jgi:hypothetical protein